MSVKITQTDAGKAIITHDCLTVLQDDRWGTNGSIAMGLLLNDDDTPNCWCLFWEWGGDWTAFGESQQYDKTELQGWEPNAVREAVNKALELFPGCEDDMGWFIDWTETAEQTLDNDE